MIKIFNSPYELNDGDYFYKLSVSVLRDHILNDDPLRLQLTPLAVESESLKILQSRLDGVNRGQWRAIAKFHLIVP